MDRRTFLTAVPAVWSAASLTRSGSLALALQEQDDAALCRSKFEIAVSRKLADGPIGDAVVEIGKTFLGTPYLASALEVPGEERLVVNMRGLDCVSFYENALTLARCIKLGTMTFEDYKSQLQWIRYRDAKINGYPSRLHYTSDYFYDNARRGTWKEMSRDLGGEVFVNTVSYMSNHPDSYRQIKDDPKLVPVIAEQEKAINVRTRYYIPKEKVKEIENRLQNGDILGTTTNFPGLDTSHTGIVIKEDGVTKFMHAPLAGKQVLISEKPLHAYLAANKGQTGIMVVRPLEPANRK
ncbi:MAG: N-acetylmuramoyl-L-alanine amidase-like domain-containing protein [Bacteroidota bacterium]